MKQLVGRIASETLFYLGHWVHFPMVWFDWAWLYPVYSGLMNASHNIQTWAGNAGPWGTVKEDV